MNKLFSMILCVTLISVLSACGGGGTNGNSSPAAKKGVTFSFSKDALVSAKPTSKSVASATLDPAASYASITVTDTNGTVVLSNYRIDIYAINGSYITATVPLTPGNYQITQFLVLDSNNNVLYLVPTQSAAAEIKALVSSVLPISFGVTTDQANTVTVQVLAPEGSTPQDFGYPSISFSIVNYVRFMSCVQIQNSTTNNWQVTNANLTVNGVNYSQPAQTTTLRVAEANSYTLVFSKAGFDSKTIILTTTDIASYQAVPLVVMLTPTVLVYHPVNFDSNGGTAVSPQSIVTGGTATRPTNPSKNGFTFVDWYSDAGLTTQFSFSTPISGDRTLYAKWAPAPGSQTWNAAGIYTFYVPAGVNVITLTVVGADGGGGAGVENDSTGGGGHGGGFSSVTYQGTLMIEAKGGDGEDGQLGDGGGPSPGQPGLGVNYSILAAGNTLVGPFGSNPITLVVGQGGSGGTPWYGGSYGGESGAPGADGHITISW